MAPSKRKVQDIFTEGSRGPAVVVVGAPQSQDVAIKAQLESLRRNDFSSDPALLAMENLYANIDDPKEELMELAESAKAHLEGKIQQEKHACQSESRVLVDMANRIEAMKQERQNLLENMNELDKKQLDLQQSISSLQDEASQEIESIDQVEEEQKNMVPRLKSQISLYASTTGIKWDFTQSDTLSGQVVRFLKID